jgi:hypothetical protein
MSNFLKDNGYNWDSIQVIPLDQVIKPTTSKTYKELYDNIDELNLLTVVIEKQNHIDNFFGEFEFESHEYVCVDNEDLLSLRMMQGVKSVHAVIIKKDLENEH